MDLAAKRQLAATLFEGNRAAYKVEFSSRPCPGLTAEHFRHPGEFVPEFPPPSDDPATYRQQVEEALRYADLPLLDEWLAKYGTDSHSL